MLIGVDAGGTGSRAVVLDRTGTCLGFGQGGGGNPVSLGPAMAGRGIRDAVLGALRQASEGGHLPPDPAAQGSFGRGVAVLAMAGASAFVAPGVMANQVREVTGVDRVEIASDLIAMFSSGGPAETGYVLVSGTGAAALRVEGGMVAASADGLGWLLGDHGSGFWIGHRAVREAVGALSGYAPPTALAPLLQSALGLDPASDRVSRGRLMSLEAAVDMFYQMEPIELAKYAQLVFRAARVGAPAQSGDPAGPGFAADADPVAVAILTDAVTHLVATLAAVRVPDLHGPVVFGGSVAKNLPGLADAVRAMFADAGMAAPTISVAQDGALGAAVLALREVGVPVDQQIFDRVSASLADLRA